MKVLGIESSCDETAAAIVADGQEVLSSEIASQVEIHQQYGGVVPELASREHVDNISFVVERALRTASCSWSDLDAVAVTRGPGLIGALLVGLAYAKAVAFARGLPFLGVNHLEGHIYSIYLDHPEAELPALSLVVSGGHTNLYHLHAIGRYELLSKTRDDAAGEAFDKLAKYLGLGYPGGPIIERLARRGDDGKVPFTLPRISDESNDFSFSGLKTAALRHARREELEQEPAGDEDSISQEILDLVASFQRSIIDQLIHRLQRALEEHGARSIQVSGGVSCNRTLREAVSKHFAPEDVPVYFPRPALTTDNAAMIAAAAFYRLQQGQVDGWDLEADPNLQISESRT